MKLREIDYGQTIKEIKKDKVLNTVFYFLMNNNQASSLPYHNNIHSLSLALIMFEIFRKDKNKQKIATLAGFLHDFNHTGFPDSKSSNLERALEGAKSVLKDKDILQKVSFIISSTEFPYKNSSENYLKDEKYGDIVIAMRLADHAWQNIFPFDVGSIGIHKEQYKDLDFKDIERVSKKFRNDSKKEFNFLSKKCPKILQPLLDLYKSK